MPSDTPRIDAHIEQVKVAKEDAARTAYAAALTWRNIDLELSPVIGRRGVVALLDRSLHKIRPDHPWLAVKFEQGSEHDFFEPLEQALLQQSGDEAAAANHALLVAFCSLLADLIGGSLTERLLLPVWESPSLGPSARS